MYTLNDLPPTVEQTRLLSNALPPWLSSLISFVVTYAFLALIRLALFVGQRKKREKEERYIRLYSRRVLLGDCSSSDARTLPPSKIRETKANSVQEDALLVLLNGGTSNLLLRSNALILADDPKRTASAAQLVDTLCEDLPGQTRTMDGPPEPRLQFRPRLGGTICSPLQPTLPINGDVATVGLVGNDKRSFMMGLGDFSPPVQPGVLPLVLHGLILPSEKPPKSPAASIYEEQGRDRGSDDPIAESSRIDVCSSSSSGVLVQSKSRLIIEASTNIGSHSPAFAMRSLLDTHLWLVDVSRNDHFSATDKFEHLAFNTLLLAPCSPHEPASQPGLLTHSSSSSTLENGPERTGPTLRAEGRAQGEDIDLHSTIRSASLRSIEDGKVITASPEGKREYESAVELDDADRQGSGTTKRRTLVTRTNCDGQVEAEGDEVSGTAVQIDSHDGARTTGPEIGMLAVDAWLVDSFTPRSCYMPSMWDDEIEGEDGSTDSTQDEEDVLGEENMMPGAWLDQEEEREVAELCTRLQDMSLVALADLLDGDAGVLRGDEARTAGSGRESGERVAEVDDSPVFEAVEEVSGLVDAVGGMKLINRFGSIVVESRSLDDTPSLELADVPSGSDLDASLRHSDWRDGDSDCSAMRGGIDLLGEDEDYVFRPEGGRRTPLFDPSDEEDGASVISQNLYYDDETGEVFFPFARHARGHGHALLEPLQRPRYHYADTERSLFVVDECKRRPMAETVGFDRRGFVFNPFAEDDDDYFEESILEASGASDASGIYPASSTDTQPSTDPGTVSADGTRRTKTRRGCRGGRRGKNRKARRQAALAAGDVGDDIVDPL